MAARSRHAELAEPRRVPSNDIDPSFYNIRGYWPTFFLGGYSWRCFGHPKLYFRPGLDYTVTDEFVATDGMGRALRSRRPFECTINPVDGKFQKLYVQATDKICGLPNGTWKRTIVRNAAPGFFRFASLPYKFVPRNRVNHVSRYTWVDWVTVVLLWIPTVACLIFAVSHSTRRGKSSFEINTELMR